MNDRRLHDLLLLWQAPPLSPWLKHRIISDLVRLQQPSWRWPIATRLRVAMFTAGLVLGAVLGMTTPAPRATIDSAQMIALLW